MKNNKDEKNEIKILKERVKELESRESDRKKAEITLQEQEEKYRALVTNVPGMVYGANSDWSVYYVSPGAETVTGYAVDDLMEGKVDWQDLIYPGDRERMSAESIAIEVKPDSLVQEYRIVNKDGSVRWVRDTKKSRFRDNVFEGVDGVVVDITERKQAEIALQEQEEKFRSISENAPVGIFITDVNGNTIYWNQLLCDITGMKNEEGFGKKWVDGVHPDDKEKVFNEWYKSVEARASFKMEYRFVDKQGNVTCTIGQAAPMKNAQGVLFGFAGTVTDITDRKKAEEALAESEAILLAAMDNSQAGIAIADAPDGKLRYVNEAGLMIRGKSKDEIVNQISVTEYVSSWQILHFDHTPYRDDEVPLARAVLYGETCTEEFIVRRANEEDRIVWANAAPIRNKKGEIIAGIVVFLDITEYKDMQTQLIQSEKLSGIGQLSSGLAHELNSPLMGLLNVLESYEKKAKSGSTEAEELEEMLKATRHMCEVVKNVNIFARESKDIFEEVDLKSVVEDILIFSKYHLEKNNIIIHKSFDPNLSKIFGEKNQLEQVVLNMITNSRDAMPNGGDFFISVRNFDDTDSVIMEFEDTGTGVKKEHLDRLFDPFFTTKKVGEGTGLGLSVAYGIITSHKGKIVVHSQEGNGTKFTITFPNIKRGKK